MDEIHSAWVADNAGCQFPTQKIDNVRSDRSRAEWMKFIQRGSLPHYHIITFKIEFSTLFIQVHIGSFKIKGNISPYHNKVLQIIVLDLPYNTAIATKRDGELLVLRCLVNKGGLPANSLCGKVDGIK